MVVISLNLKLPWFIKNKHKILKKLLHNYKKIKIPMIKLFKKIFKDKINYLKENLIKENYNN